MALADSLTAEEIWLSFGVGRHFRYTPAVQPTKVQKILALQTIEPILYAVTGCDTVSSFAGKQKKTVFDAWQVNPEMTHVMMYSSAQWKILKQ